jgi:FtsP/CotA-like multicopper oxidase with cupredoxin domain
MRRVRWTVVVIAGVLLAAGCTAAGGDAAGADGEQAAGAAVPIAISLTEFVISPSMIDAPAGSPLRFEVSNDGQAPHTFAVETDDASYDTGEIAPGASATLDVPALEPGDYAARCTITGHDQLGMTAMLMVGASATGASGATGAAHADMTAEEMAAGHKEGVEAFASQLEKGPLTDVNGNQPLEPRIGSDGVKEFDLTVTQLRWETVPGTFVDAMAFNGQIPGPELRVNPGDEVRVFVQNQMDQPFALHFHGVTLPNAMDGVPYITQDPIMPGEGFAYRFTVRDPPGMYVYHSHFNSTEQVGKGLYGAFIVEPKGGAWRSVYGVTPNVEATMFLGDGPLGYTLNGKSFPATLGIVADRGDWVLIHMANDGSLLHPMHLHGYHFMVVSEDGFPLAAANRYMADTLVVAPGSRFDILVHATEPGIWALHCHILPHVEGPQGMYGMVTALVVQ